MHKGGGSETVEYSALRITFVVSIDAFKKQLNLTGLGLVIVISCFDLLCFLSIFADCESPCHFSL